MLSNEAKCIHLLLLFDYGPKYYIITILQQTLPVDLVHELYNIPWRNWPFHRMGMAIINIDLRKPAPIQIKIGRQRVTNIRRERTLSEGFKTSLQFLEGSLFLHLIRTVCQSASKIVVQITTHMPNTIRRKPHLNIFVLTLAKSLLNSLSRT